MIGNKAGILRKTAGFIRINAEKRVFAAILAIGLALAGCIDPAADTTVPPPSAPTGLSSIAQTETTIALVWNPVNGAHKYHVYIGSTAGNLFLHSSTDSTSCLLSSLIPKTAYYFAVSAENKAGEGEKSPPITVTTGQGAKPAAPSGLKADAITDNAIAVSWSAVAGASSYKIFAGTSQTAMTLRGTATANNFQITGLYPNTGYLIAVSAATAANESDPCVPIIVTTGQGVKPASPTGLKADAITDNAITVSWDAVAGVSSYKIFAGTAQAAMTLRGTATAINYQITGLNQNTGYFIAVSSVTTTNESDQCAPISIVTKPPAPSGLTAGTITSNSIAISWTAISGISTYNVYAGTSTSDMAHRGTTTAASCSLTGLSSNTTYYIAVSAQNASGEGNRAASINRTTLLAAPTGLTAESIPPSTVRLSWNSVSGAASYKIYRSTSPTSGFANIYTATSITHNDTGLSQSTTYYYKISAVNAGNAEGEQSTVVSKAIATSTKEITSFSFESFSVNGTINGPNITITVPNIVNLTTLVPSIAHNGKSIAPASGTAQNFSSPIQYTVTSEDNTTQTYTVTVTPSNTTLATALTWINSNARPGETYTIAAMANESMEPRRITPWSSVNIILNGGTAERTISLSSNGSLFTIENGTLTLGNNITLQGRSSNTASLVRLDGGNLIMNTGSKIINNTVITTDNNAEGGAVYVWYGTFTMNDGTISGNRVQVNSSTGYLNSVRAKGGGVYADDRFIMNGGTITNNTAYSEYYECAGGGVFVDTNGRFTLSNGTISYNLADSKAIMTSPYAYGGGVAIWSSGVLTMQGGTMSGNIARAYASGLATSYSYGGGVYARNGQFTKTGGAIYGSNGTAAQKNEATAANNNGHAAYAVVGSSILRRNNTADTTVNLDSGKTGSAGGWE